MVCRHWWQGREDTLAWHFDTKGVFSVKSAYHVLEDNRERQNIRQEGEGSSEKAAKDVCGRFDEDGGHCFFKCKFVKRCWREMNLEETRLQRIELKSAYQVVQCIQNMQEEQRLATIGLLWAWWDARNKVNAGEQLRRTSEVIFRARSIRVENMSMSSGDVASVSERPVHSWVPPGPDILKINTDGSFLGMEKAGAWGFTDSHCLAAAIRSDVYDNSPGGAIYSEIRNLLDLHFTSVEISVIPRSCNRCAHDLARLGLTWDSDEPHVWLDPLPIFVIAILDRDHTGPMV
ncbi:hypothetical protein BS78_02G054800 [Paspalum vaginatum]|nr:hypothetical protein BS78_02G054800 [Paspalum vaginatum]